MFSQLFSQDILLGFEPITAMVTCAYIIKLLINNGLPREDSIDWSKRSLIGQRIASRASRS